jgi:NAD(P)H-hydrate epimerase
MVAPFANPGMATAGTGDVLAGAIAGLTSQGISLFEAAACGVYVHGKAGEMVRDELGDAGMVAGDLLPVLPRAIKSIMRA